jgi:hypothetical protein
MAGGHCQVKGVNYGDIFTSVVKLPSIRLILAYSAANDWEIHHVDVMGAFLNVKLDEEIYKEPPEGALGPGDEGKVCKLLRWLYGLRQAGRAWYKDLKKTFDDMGFVCSNMDHSVFIRQRGNKIVVVLVATDDMTVTGTPLSAVEKFKRELTV